MSQDCRCRRFTPWGIPWARGRRDISRAMTRRLITIMAVTMVFASATAYTAITPIHLGEYPDGCRHPNGEALQGHRGFDDLVGTRQRDLLRGGRGNDGLLGYEQSDCL